jgi:hypothetical protein
MNHVASQITTPKAISVVKICIIFDWYMTSKSQFHVSIQKKAKFRLWKASLIHAMVIWPKCNAVQVV